MSINEERIEKACIVMHDAYEKAAKTSGWKTNPKSAVPWEDVPETNKQTMRVAVEALFDYLYEEKN